MQANFKDVAIALRNQFPDCWGVRLRLVNSTIEYPRVNFLADAAREAVLKKDFTCKGKRVIVSRVYSTATTIIRVSVSNLPFDPEQELKAHMSKIVANYGSILEMGLLHTYATLTHQIDSLEACETLRITYTGMKPTCNRCHVTDHVFGNCPVIRRRVKLCHIWNSPDHLQHICPEAWWNARKKFAKTSSAHTSPHPQSPLDKAALPIVHSSFETVESSPNNEKATKPFITGIVPASPNESTNSKSTTKESPSTADAPVLSSSSDEDGEITTASVEEQTDNGDEVGASGQESSTVIQDQQGDTPEDAMDGDMDDDDEEIDDRDIDMVDPEKEVAASSLPL
ncbi:hypothetical protein MAM1_0415c10406 [Mucor ambiguus]|uniref:Uncharacterized protein n=1 Tax=Mucor ambiguus TaxID=91626 RepID=A0A0C9MJ32_9FUNG|nr:hypothetical protein MAM1_0415c10406 [Mucor ambiguus]